MFVDGFRLAARFALLGFHSVQPRSLHRLSFGWSTAARIVRRARRGAHAALREQRLEHGGGAGVRAVDQDVGDEHEGVGAVPLGLASPAALFEQAPRVQVPLVELEPYRTFRGLSQSLAALLIV